MKWPDEGWYKQVLYGMDYISSEKEQQLALLRASLLEHCSQYPEALIVVEEYDKLDCSTRGFLRQLFENARAANVTLDRSALTKSNVPVCIIRTEYHLGGM